MTPSTPDSFEALLDKVRSDAAEYAARTKAADEYAGPNIMAHYGDDGITCGGRLGFLQMFTRTNSVEAAKFRTGAYLQAARRNRFLGYRKAVQFNMDLAAVWRRAALIISHETPH